MTHLLEFAKTKVWAIRRKDFSSSFRVEMTGRGQAVCLKKNKRAVTEPHEFRGK